MRTQNKEGETDMTRRHGIIYATPEGIIFVDDKAKKEKKKP